MEINIEGMTLSVDNIMDWPEVQFTETNRVLAKYYHLKVPVALIKQAIMKEPDLAMEVLDDSIADTYPREWLLDCIMAEMNLPEWPMNAHSDEYKEQFRLALDEQMRVHGIEVIMDK